jgi:hypothetical protein
MAALIRANEGLTRANESLTRANDTLTRTIETLTQAHDKSIEMRDHHKQEAAIERQDAKTARADMARYALAFYQKVREPPAVGDHQHTLYTGDPTKADMNRLGHPYPSNTKASTSKTEKKAAKPIRFQRRGGRTFSR